MLWDKIDRETPIDRKNKIDFNLRRSLPASRTFLRALLDTRGPRYGWPSIRSTSGLTIPSYARREPTTTKGKLLDSTGVDLLRRSHLPRSNNVFASFYGSATGNLEHGQLGGSDQSRSGVKSRLKDEDQSAAAAAPAPTTPVPSSSRQRQQRIRWQLGHHEPVSTLIRTEGVAMNRTAEWNFDEIITTHRDSDIKRTSANFEKA